MNASYVASVFACLTISTIIHTSEERSLTQAQALPAWAPVIGALKEDYNSYLQNRLEEYKKTETDTPTPTIINMDDLVAMGVRMTGCSGAADAIHEIKDEKGNTFIHIAVEKGDLPTVQWICQDPRFKGTPTNKMDHCALDLCMQKLTPCSVHEQKNSVAHKMLYALIERTGKTCSPSNNPYKTVCLRQIAAVQLAYKKASHELVLTPEIIQCLLPSEKDFLGLESFLSTIYKETTDEDGNTFTHVLVEKELPDELFEWIKQGRVSFEKNKAQLTPVDTALALVRFFTQNVALIADNKTSFEKRKCCLFMLLNYLKIKSGQDANAHFVNCCSKHRIT